MRREHRSQFDPSSQVRMVCATVAIAATLATAGFIDALAKGYGSSAPSIVKKAPVVVAKR